MSPAISPETDGSLPHISRKPQTWIFDFALHASQPSQHPDKSSWTSKGRFCSFKTKATKTERKCRGANIPIWRPLLNLWMTQMRTGLMWGFEYGRILPFLQMATGATPPTPQQHVNGTFESTYQLHHNLSWDIFADFNQYWCLAVARAFVKKNIKAGVTETF